MGAPTVEQTIFERPAAEVENPSGLLSREQLLARLHAIGAER